MITGLELHRAVARARQDRPDAVIDGSVILHGIVDSAAVIPLDEEVVSEARKVSPVTVGALDAIHIASALSLRQQLAGVATYDRHMQKALEQAKVNVVAPT